MKILIFRGLLGVVVAAMLAFGVDAVLLHYRANRDAFGTVTVRPYYAVPLKDKKTEYLFDDPEDETCVHSAFPHMGYSPCWYLERHRERQMLK